MSTAWPDWRESLTADWWPAAMAIVALAALAYRAPLVPAVPLNGDEAITLWWISDSLGTVVADVPRRQPHPPLYYVLAHAVAPAGKAIARLRWLSVLASTLTVVLTGVLVRQLVSREAGAVAGVAAAATPLLVDMGVTIRMYALLAALSTAALVALVHALQTGSQRARWAWAGLLTATVWTHFFGWFVVAAHAAILLWVAVTERTEWRPWWPPTAVAVALSLPVAGLIGAKLLLPAATMGTAAQAHHLSGLAAPDVLGLVGKLVASRWVGGLDDYLAMQLVLLGAAGALWIWRRRPDRHLATAVLGAAVVVPVAAAVVTTWAVRPVVDLWTPRYLVSSTPPLVGLGAAGLLEVPSDATVRVAALLLLVATLSAAGSPGVTDRIDFNAAADRLEATADQPTPRLLSDAGSSIGPFDLLLERHGRASVAHIGDQQPGAIEAQVRRGAAGHATLWTFTHDAKTSNGQAIVSTLRDMGYRITGVWSQDHGKLRRWLLVDRAGDRQ